MINGERERERETWNLLDNGRSDDQRVKRDLYSRNGAKKTHKYRQISAMSLIFFAIVGNQLVFQFVISVPASFSISHNFSICHAQYSSKSVTINYKSIRLITRNFWQSPPRLNLNRWIAQIVSRVNPRSKYTGWVVEIFSKQLSISKKNVLDKNWMISKETLINIIIIL